VDGYRAIVQTLLDLAMPSAAIRQLIGGNAAALLNLAPQAAEGRAA
jgi:hypothetical protein